MYGMADPFTDDQLSQVAKLAGYGLTQAQIADWFGVHDRTLRKWMEADDAIAAAYKTGRAKAIDTIASKLYERAKEGDNTAAIFWLKTNAGWRETNRTELTGADGGPIQAETHTSDPIEYITGEMARLTTNRNAKAAAAHGRGNGKR